MLPLPWQQLRSWQLPNNRTSPLNADVLQTFHLEGHPCSDVPMAGGTSDGEFGPLLSTHCTAKMSQGPAKVGKHVY